MHIVDVVRLHVETPLIEAGLNSSAALEFSARLRSETGLALSPTLTFDQPTSKAIAGYLEASGYVGPLTQPREVLAMVEAVRKDVQASKSLDEGSEDTASEDTKSEGTSDEDASPKWLSEASLILSQPASKSVPAESSVPDRTVLDAVVGMARAGSEAVAAVVGELAPMSLNWPLPVATAQANADVIWVVYLSREQLVTAPSIFQDYFRSWREAHLCSVPVSLMRRRQLRGVVLMLTSVWESLDARPALLRKAFDQILHDYGHSRAIALAGRLPALAAREQVPTPRPMVTEQVGTVAMTVSSVRHLLAQRGRSARTRNVAAVFGGCGFTGHQIALGLRRICSEVIVVDPAAPEAAEKHNGLTYSRDAGIAARANVVVVFTPRGDDVYDIIGQAARAGQLWADDTHPQMSHNTRVALVEAGVELFKLTAIDPDLSYSPPIPSISSNWVPGCLVTALMIASAAELASASGSAADLDLSDLDACQRAFDDLGLLTPETRHEGVDEEEPKKKPSTTSGSSMMASSVAVMNAVTSPIASMAEAMWDFGMSRGQNGAQGVSGGSEGCGGVDGGGESGYGEGGKGGEGGEGEGLGESVGDGGSQSDVQRQRDVQQQMHAQLVGRHVPRSKLEELRRRSADAATLIESHAVATDGAGTPASATVGSAPALSSGGLVDVDGHARGEPESQVDDGNDAYVVSPDVPVDCGGLEPLPSLQRDFHVLSDFL
jgi:hypothetical protein